MIPLVKPIFGAREKKLLSEIIDSGIIASGTYVQDFETVCARYSKAKFAVATSNGTTALHTALLASGIKPGEKVHKNNQGPSGMIYHSSCSVLVFSACKCLKKPALKYAPWINRYTKSSCARR